MKYQSFKIFYNYYLTQHEHPLCRVFHYAGTIVSVILAIWMILHPVWWKLLLIPAFGYGFSWLGHFLFEKNQPAAFSNPFYSLISDFVMCFHFLTGQLNKKMRDSETNH